MVREFSPALRLPAVVNLVEIFFPDDSPESPEERLRVADDGNFEASAEEERFLIDDAMVGGEDGAGVAGVRGEVGVWIGRVLLETELDTFVRLAAGDADVGVGRHGSWLVRGRL